MSAPESSRYLQSAKRVTADPDTIFDTATQQGFDAADLARLVDVLRDHHSWKLTKARRDPLIDGLLELDWSPTEIAARLGCSRQTVYTRAERRAEGSRPTPVHRMNKRPECPVSALPVSYPILSFSASGCDPEQHREIRRILGGTVL